MLQKRLLTLLMAAIATTSLAFVPQEDDSPKQEQEKAKAALKAVVEGGKLFVIDANGEKQEIDMSDARSIVLRQSSRVVEENGDQLRESSGKAVIIGPDGKETVLELDGPGALALPGMNLRAGNFDLAIPQRMQIQLPDGANIVEWDELPGVFRVDRANIGKYMIGVHCQPVGGSLRSHLQLEDGVGLLIQSVSPDMPAESELAQHDILMYADDQQLGSVSDLSKAVEAAGEEDRAISLTLIREGEEKNVKVKPTERPEMEIEAQGFAPAVNNFQIQRFGPGIILEQEEDMQEVIKNLREEMSKMRSEMEQMMERDR